MWQKYRNVQTPARVPFLVDLLCTCCTVFLTDLLTNISTTLATHNNNFDVLAACCTINVASSVAMLHLHTAVTVCSFKLVSVAKTNIPRRH